MIEKLCVIKTFHNIELERSTMFLVQLDFCVHLFPLGHICIPTQPILVWACMHIQFVAFTNQEITFTNKDTNQANFEDLACQELIGFVATRNKEFTELGCTLLCKYS